MLPMNMKFTGWIAISTRIPRKIFFGQGGPNFGGGKAENLGKMAKTGKPIVMQIPYWPLLPGIKSLHYFGFPAC